MFASNLDWLKPYLVLEQLGQPANLLSVFDTRFLIDLHWFL